MPYTVEITTPPVRIDGAEQASRMYQLPDPFSTLAEAKEAAIAHIGGLGLDPAGILYTVSIARVSRSPPTRIRARGLDRAGRRIRVPSRSAGPSEPGGGLPARLRPVRGPGSVRERRPCRCSGTRRT
uniref:hypothetical protein n=1 Tax=Methylobacterium sp. B34 TaxID=95563 RepID=UPI0003494DF9|nr:hypothetical protein [Methylobacterium sp. B34]